MTEKRPSRLAVAHIYAKRAVRWRSNSYPYISGDAFADLADYVHEPPRWRNINKGSLENARVIFVRSESLQKFFSENSHKIKASIIVTGNSDYEFHSPLFDIPSSVKAIFLQNSFISDGIRFHSIPLGIENLRWGVNGNPTFIKDREKISPSKPKILFGPLGKTHPVREAVTRDFDSDSKHWDFCRGRIKPQHFDSLAKKYTHIAAVRGNGVDTHRLWESLYRGVTPIVESSAWWNSLSMLFPEVQIVEEWTHENVLEVLARSTPPRSFRKNPALWMPYWENQINKYLS